MGLLGASPSLPRQGWVVILGSQAALLGRWSLEKIQLMLLLSDIAPDTMKWRKEGSSFAPGILPCGWTGQGHPGVTQLQSHWAG